uniref:Uncharacterized protein n=1 Tax=Oryza sativa subsp. japonica TaxID=39947 RepID=Q6Z0L8_ORYSJ|nr:hypothetical protein [Oryza sativa Japonica Group]
MPEVVVVQQADEPGRRKGRPKGRRRRRGWRGRRGDGVPAKPRSSRGRGRCSDAEGGGGDVGRRTGNATVAAGGGTVAATPLFCRRERVSGVFPAKRRADRGRGGGCEAEGEDGAAGRCSGEEGEAAGGGRRGGKRGATAGTRLRRSPRETEGRPGWRRRLRCCRRRRRGRPALRQGGRGGWRRPAAREREGDGGEVARDHGRPREGAKAIERSEGVEFYRREEGAGHGGGRNGGGKGGRPQWKAAGLGARNGVGFAREGERGRGRRGRRKTMTTWRVGPTRLGARRQRAHVRSTGGRCGSAWRGGVRLGPGGREGRGGKEAAREREGGGSWAEGKGSPREGGREGEGEKKREERETLGWAWPKGGRGLFF